MPRTYNEYSEPFQYEDIKPVSLPSYSPKALAERITKLENEVRLLKELVLGAAGVPELVEKISGK